MGKTLADLQSNISISAENAATGDIEFCSGYTGFSDDASEQSGWYLALKVSPSVGGTALEGATITATYGGTVRTLADGETFIIRLAEGEDSITFAANKEGYIEGRLTLDLSGLTLIPKPYNPETDPFFELTGVVYNGHTYDVSDFVSGGTLTRGYNGSQNNLALTGATIKYCGIDPDADQNYYLAFTSRVGAEGEHQGKYYDFTELSLSNPLNSPPSPHTIPQTFLIKIDRNTSNISGNGKIEVPPGHSQSKSPKIYFENCTWEADPRPAVHIDWTMLPPTAQYNGTPVSNYVVNTYQTSKKWPVTQTYTYNNGYYGFLWIKNGEINTTNNLSNYINYTDITADITGIQLGTYDKVYMYDITTLNNSGAYVKFSAPGYRSASDVFIEEYNQILPAYANGLTPRNMTIKPLDSTAKADKFGKWCDINFSPIDPATATVVNNEITVSVSGTINTRASDDSQAGYTLSNDYKPMYKTRDNYQSIESGQKLWFNKNKHYFIVEIDNAFILIDGINPPPWQCKGFTSTQTTFTPLGGPTKLSSAKKSIWAIPIESGATSVSIKCVPRFANTYTEVIYTFDLTNVIYGTFS